MWLCWEACGLYSLSERTEKSNRLQSTLETLYATGRLEDSRRQNDEKIVARDFALPVLATFFRHSVVLSLPAVLLLKVSIVADTAHSLELS